MSRVRCLRPVCEMNYTWHLISKNYMTGREVLGEGCVKLDFSSAALSRYLVVQEKGLKCNFHLIPSWSQVLSGQHKTTMTTFKAKSMYTEYLIPKLFLWCVLVAYQTQM